MKILYSPQFNDKNKIEYTFFGEIIKVEISTLVEKEEKSNFELDSVFYYDLSSVKEEVYTQGHETIISAKRVDGEMIVQLLMYIGSNATKEERFPEEFVSEDEEFDIPEGTEIIQLEEIVMPEPEPDLIDQIKTENKALEVRLESMKRQLEDDRRMNEETTLELLELMMGLI